MPDPIFTTNHGPPSPLAVPFPPSAKIHRTSIRKPSPIRATLRSRTSPSSPARRPLAPSSDNGNSVASSPAKSRSHGGHKMSRSASPAERRSMEKEQRRSSVILSDGASPTPTVPAISRLDSGTQPGFGGGPSAASPLKRTDETMRSDQSNMDSPIAKRRSLHGASFGADFNAFDHGPSTSEEEGSPEGEDVPPESPQAGSSPFLSSMPKRSSSLRKSTLQQRYHDRPTFARSRLNNDLALEFGTPGHGAKSKHQRMSLENFLPPMPRDSPFNSQGSLPNASAHPLKLGGSSQESAVQMVHQPHPLSQAITQSSSGSSLVEESPTHVPVHFGEHPRPMIDFSRSLPAGATRPSFARDPTDVISDPHTSSGEHSYVTPKNYKLVKPLPAAFMSTGLISKRNRNPEEQPVGAGTKAHMPDTPCKRPTTIFQAGPAPMPGSAFGRPRNARHEFGTPSTPYNPHQSGPTQANVATAGKGVGIFGSAFGQGRLARSGSFVSISGDEGPNGKCELPPTPTKHVLDSSGSHQSGPVAREPSSHPISLTTDNTCIGLEGFGSSQEEQSCKSSSIRTPTNSVYSDSGSEMDVSPSIFRFSSSLSSMSPSSFTQSRLLRGHPKLSPTPLFKNSLTAPELSARRTKFAKMSHLSPASPVETMGTFTERLCPRTPQDSMLPPDPSGLSISGQGAQSVRPAQDISSSASSFPPATPTASREYFPHVDSRQPSVTPLHGFVAADIDACLTSRFEKVELIGTGEFSQVYRVAETWPSPPTFGSSAGTSPRASTTDRIYAVKKSRHPYAGAKDRQRKLQEVAVLKALGQADHVVQMVDDWEDRNHLYIQTEFCEEGSLDLFLAQVGRKARLDDFRIWKVMLELSLGLQHIHDAGFIHLDLKPANVLITFEGVLKIGDFGMAASWPAQPGIEGEGDREYIGPEILKGQFDKPADVFALGLIMLEIAANVELPDNGPTWQKLRTGDMSDVPSLTFSSTSNVCRDSSGNPVSREESSEGLCVSDSGDDDFGSPNFLRRQRREQQKADGSEMVGISRRGELVQPPSFMIDAQNEQALDRVVRWMISPEPGDRPVVDQILGTVGVKWAEMRRRAGATVFEGNWGPADDVLSVVDMAGDDAEMVDV
ncbi:MAG: hypothetical protein M1817_000966 [Caeruleum heppii]|nr:MAG: hypothetical protein M1817_000966 [Caeruleum heppii]